MNFVTSLLRLGARFFLVRRKIVFEAPVASLVETTARRPVAFRIADSGDLERLPAKRYDYDDKAKQYARERLQAGDRFVVGEDDGAVVFYAWLTIGQMDLGLRSFYTLGSGSVSCWRIFTVPECRGQRTSPAYYAFVRRWLATVGAERIVSWVEARNRASLRMHDSAGFTRLGAIWQIRLLGRTYHFVPSAVARRLRRGAAAPKRAGQVPEHPAPEQPQLERL